MALFMQWDELVHIVIEVYEDEDILIVQICRSLRFQIHDLVCIKCKQCEMWRQYWYPIGSADLHTDVCLVIHTPTIVD